LRGSNFSILALRPEARPELTEKRASPVDFSCTTAPEITYDDAAVETKGDKDDGATMAATKIAAVEEEDQDEARMDEQELAHFRTILEEKRLALMKNAQASLEQDMQLDTNEMPDEVDLASSEYIQSFSLRLRGRERNFLDKIEMALRKLEQGEFGVCEECGGAIGKKRLEARPETTLCIRCKEDQERNERDFK
jgi:DnaK suppressor protein